MTNIDNHTHTNTQGENIITSLTRVINSDFLDTVELNDLYMADRGFDIKNDLLLKRAH